MPKSPLTGKTVKPGSNRTGVKSGPNAKKTGPKPIAIDWNQLAILAGLHCTQEEAAGFLGVSVNTLTNRYAIEHDDETLGEFMKRNRDKGKAKLRVAQLKSAIDNESVAMQIWLGKNWLGQSDKIDHTAQEKPRIVLNYENPNGIDSHNEDRDSDRDAGILEIGRPNDDGEKSI